MNSPFGYSATYSLCCYRNTLALVLTKIVWPLDPHRGNLTANIEDYYLNYSFCCKGYLHPLRMKDNLELRINPENANELCIGFETVEDAADIPLCYLCLLSLYLLLQKDSFDQTQKD